jgi:hypothetical protein
MILVSISLGQRPSRRDTQPTPLTVDAADKSPTLRPTLAEQHEAAITKALDKTIAVDIKGVPIEQAVRDLAHLISVPVEFDRERIKDDGVSLDTPVTLNVPQITLRSALRLMFEHEQLAFLVANETLLVTTSQSAADMLETRIYDVSDLVLTRDAKVPGRADFTSLMNVISTCVQPDSWENLSGSGSIMPISSGALRSIAVRQMQDVHDQVARILADLRKARRSPGDDSVRDVLVRSDRSPAALRETAIRDALDKLVSVDAKERPLSEAISDVANQIGVPVFIDRRKVAEEGISLDAPTTFHHQEMTARSALAILLKPRQLAWIVKNELLFITTSASVADSMVTRVYDVSDIATRFRDERGNTLYDLTSLMNAITTTIEPDSDWGNGPGVIMPYRSGGIVALTFPQAIKVHEAVARFLTELVTCVSPAVRRLIRKNIYRQMVVCGERDPRLIRGATRSSVGTTNSRWSFFRNWRATRTAISLFHRIAFRALSRWRTPGLAVKRRAKLARPCTTS